MKSKDFLIKNGVNVEKSLELFGDMNTYNDTLKEFVKDIAEERNNLKKYKEISDMQNYAIYAHSIKSDAKYFGFDKLCELALNHEMNAKKNNMYYITDHYIEFVREIKKCENIAREYLDMDLLNEDNEHTEVVTKDKLLIVDDSPVIKKFVENVFRNSFNVIDASCGEEAIKIINNDRGDIKIMLLDLNMPNSNGFMVLDYLKNNDLVGKLPVTIITGIGAKSVLDKVKDYPIDNILLKPFNENTVKKVVEDTAKKEEVL